jgi:DNA replication and repair protein RecF
MYLKKLHLTNFRNYVLLSLDFSREGALFIGKNGSGKTNILEAIHLLCTGRSQRNARRTEMIRFTSENCRIDGDFFSDKDQKGIQFSFSFSRQNAIDISVNGRKIFSFSEWFGMQPTVSFSPGDCDLVFGSPDIRRRYLDMLICQVDREYLNMLMVYRRNLLERNRLLKLNDDPILFSIYEKAMAEAGAVIYDKRGKAIVEINETGSAVYASVSGKNEYFSLTYAPGFRHDNSGLNSWKEVFFTMLSEHRKRDRECGFSSFGPHRDDMLLQIDSKAAKTYSSQGQCRTIALSLKLGSMRYLENHGHENMIVLFDDAVSELDPYRTARMYAHVENRGQVMIASPHKNVDCTERIKRYHVAENTAVAYDR